MERKFFVASNSGNGFVSYYNQVFDKIPQVYVIKGGPGTGKNKFMAAVAAEAVLKGAEVEYFYCSSDPLSLDGVIINSTIALADGTAPHVYEPKTVGAHENILNLGQFWNRDVLSRQRDVIEYLSERKSDCYERAYGFLSTSKKLETIKKSILSPYINYERINESANRICKDEMLPQGSGLTDKRLCNSVGMSGFYRFTTYEEMASRIYCIVDFVGLGYEYMSAVRAVCENIKADLYLSHSYLYPEYYDAIFEKKTRCAFCTYKKEEQTKLLDNETLCERICTINTQRFLDFKGWRLIRDEWMRIDKLDSEILALAVDEMKKISNYHFALEEIYSSAMDFRAKEEYTKDFIKTIFS